MTADDRLAPVIQLLESSSTPASVLDGERRVLYRNRAYQAAVGRELGLEAVVPLADGWVIETYRNSLGKPAAPSLGALAHEAKMSSLGRLAAGIAHEINNPINFVYGNVDFLGQYLEDLLSLVTVIDGARDVPADLRRRIDDTKRRIDYDYLVEDARRLLRSIQIGVDRTASIVRDLKSFSHAGGGELREMDVAANLDTTLNLIAPLHKHRIAIERDYGADLPKLWCHAGRLNQVFMNILTNAAQAIEGEGTIRIEVDTVGGGEGLRVAITDDGIGIDPDCLDQITDPFFTTKEVGEGTGLGLWISENIVRSHGGTLTWESEPGRGSTFVIELPLRR